MQGEVVIPGNVTGPDAPAKPEATPERPAWLPEKFKTAEDMVKSYTELEKKLGSQPAPEEQDEKTETAPGLEVPKQQEQAPARIQDLSEYEAEFAKSGKLSDESYSKLDKAGYSKAVVDNYIAGQMARADQMKAEVFNSVGGQDNYSKLMQWAAQGLSAAEQNAYNKAVASGDLSSAKLAAAGLMAKYQQTYGRDPNLTGGRAAPAGAEPYSAWAEVSRDMAKREYKESPAFRQKVQDRLAASKI